MNNLNFYLKPCLVCQQDPCTCGANMRREGEESEYEEAEDECPICGNNPCICGGEEGSTEKK